MEVETDGHKGYGNSRSVTTSGSITALPSLDRSDPISIAPSQNVVNIESVTKMEGESQFHENSKEKVESRTITSDIQYQPTECNNSWTSLFSFVDRVLLFFYIITLLIFHS